MRRLHHALLGASLALAACSDASGPDPAELAIAVEGHLERGAPVQFTAALDGSAVASGVSWIAEPAASVAWESEGRARFTAAGPVRIVGTLGDAVDTLQLVVTVPPSIVLERVVGGQRDLWRVALDGAELTRLTDNPAEDRWPSVGGGAVYFVSFRSPTGVYTSPPAGGSAERVTTTGSVFQEAVVSPDGQRLAFARQVGGVSKLFVSDRNGGNSRRVDPASDGGSIEGSPAWSPDGARLVYMTTASGTADIAIISVAGGAPQRLAATTAPEVEPAWSPDGTRLVLVRALAGGETRIFVVEVAGGQERRLTTAPGATSESRPTYLPDGRVVFLRSAAGPSLAWVDPARPDEVVTMPGGIVAESRPVPLVN